MPWDCDLQAKEEFACGVSPPSPALIRSVLEMRTARGKGLLALHCKA